MSILGRKAPHRAHVQDRAESRDSGGRRTWTPVGDPVTHPCHVYPVRDWSSAEESYTDGLQVLDMLVIDSKTWTGDVNSHVTIDGDGYEGLWEPVGAPQHFSASRRTAHWRVTVRRVK